MISERLTDSQAPQRWEMLGRVANAANAANDTDTDRQPGAGLAASSASPMISERVDSIRNSPAEMHEANLCVACICVHACTRKSARDSIVAFSLLRSCYPPSIPWRSSPTAQMMSLLPPCCCHLRPPRMHRRRISLRIMKSYFMDRPCVPN